MSEKLIKLRAAKPLIACSISDAGAVCVEGFQEFFQQCPKSYSLSVSPHPATPIRFCQANERDGAGFFNQRSFGEI